MSKREALSRCNLIVNRIRKSPATLKEIKEFLKKESEIQGYSFQVSSRTFKRDLEDIWSLYGIEIIYDFSKKIYQINSEDQPDLNNRMLEAFNTFNALNLSNGFSKYVHFENRKPQGTENFPRLLHAIKANKVISFTYQKFWTDELSSRKAAPYALKEFKGRWYVLAKDEKDDRIKTFGLDRISNLEISRKKFTYPTNFDITDLYRNSFGIINSIETEPEDIILSFDPEQGKYLKTFKLHSSQVNLIDTEKELQIHLKLYITFDFVMEILSYGAKVKVIAPDSLKEQLKSHYKSALSFYK